MKCDPLRLMSRRSWDALSDYLLGGIHSIDESGVAIIWEDSLQLSEGSPEVFSEACSVLAEVAESLGDPKFTTGRPKQVRVFVSRRTPQLRGC
ncbi:MULTISPECIES: barstar family protein [Streptomyces]|uniref:barstar family protein n=1 Tax=Streptomyces TaxID=1883 RepID=UPI00386FD6B7